MGMNLSRVKQHAIATAARIAQISLLTLCMIAPAVAVSGQVVPAGYGNSNRLWVGGEYSNFTPSFGPAVRIAGVGAFADWNLNPRWGVEGEARFLRFNGFYGEAQNTYLAGPKFMVLKQGKFRPFAKFLIGMGDNHFPFKIGNGSYLAYAPGAGLNYRLTRRIALRGDYEYQLWPSAPGIAGEPSNGMKPNGFSAGFAYSLLGRR